MVTLATIAKTLGVSRATVSLVLNGRAKRARISEETVEKVRAYCQKVNYLPNIHAQRMTQEVVRNIMVFLKMTSGVSPESSFYDYNVTRFLGGIASITDQAKFTFVIRLYRPGMDEKEIFDAFRNRDIDGMLYYGMTMPTAWIQTFINEHRRVVGIGTMPGVLPSVNIDNREISRELTNRMIAQGRRRFVYLCGTSESYPGAERCAGFREALATAGVPFDPKKQCFQGDFQETKGTAIAKKLLARKSQLPDAVVCANDAMAVGVMQTLLQAGVKVPEEVAVVGGDDIELCRYVQPGLTTFDNRPFDLGKTACQTLLKLIDNKPMKNKNLVLKSKILSRKSL